MAAWYVNVAARASLVSLREWLALGASLRAAQAGLDMARVRSLGAGRTSLENRVMRDLSTHLAALAVTVRPAALDEVRATLRAALADESAADLVAAGRLERALSYGGFGEVDLSEALAAMAAQAEPEPEPEQEPEPEPEPGPDPTLIAAVEQARERRDRAEAALAVAQRELREARAALAQAERASES